MKFSHISVLLQECLEGLAIRPDGIYLDGTAGGGGHSLEIAKRLTTGRLIALDKDPAAVQAAGERLRGLPAQVVESDYADIPQVLNRLGIGTVDGILLDLAIFLAMAKAYRSSPNSRMIRAMLLTSQLFTRS